MISEEEVKARLKRRAEHHGRSMEDEIRHILRNAVKESGRPITSLGSRIAARFTDVGLSTDLPELHGQSHDRLIQTLIILDTNVLSELMQKAPDPSVVEWLDRQPAESVWITSITLFEACLGLALLPKCRRRQALELAFEQLLVEDLEERVLDFDRSAAEAAAGLAAERQQNGRTVDMRDTQIAGNVIARRAALATRNLKHLPASLQRS